MEAKDKQEQGRSERAWQLGREYGDTNPLKSVGTTEQMYRAALQGGCPMAFFDVFKYGAQDIWREKGEL